MYMVVELLIVGFFGVFFGGANMSYCSRVLNNNNNNNNKNGWKRPIYERRKTILKSVSKIVKDSGLKLRIIFCF